MNILSSVEAILAERSGMPFSLKMAQYVQSKNPMLNNYNNFSQVMTNMGMANTTSLLMPTPPTPPSDPTNVAAQQNYQNALTVYNQQFQAYQTRMMGMFMQRLQMMQQSMMQARSAQQSSSSSSGPSASLLGGSSSSTPMGVGGIL